ncbi:DUF7010 family protein [Peribacillus glennii]|uniref:Uncharacterized protein n=1 Tax=Peribacillus glennii TaxID=2303991 RepID=A0A372LD48_9BACI|nr:hypothetical protein [Peribacillus glennii]RFU63922.1 hypothetical protein D0466_10750 [Peribacillus glennii]
MQRTLKDYKNELIKDAKKGYSILLAGAIYHVVLGVLTLMLDLETIQLIWVIGMGCIFPLGVMIGKTVGVDYFTKNNPLGTLGGLMAGVQAFYIPVYIMVLQQNPVWLPFTIGLLGGSHFLVYYWIYDSKAYLFQTFAMALASLVMGGFFQSLVFETLPFVIAGIFLISVFLILRELKVSGTPTY